MNYLSQNRIKDLRKYKNKKYRSEHGLYWVEGLRSVKSILDSGETPYWLILSEDFDKKLPLPSSLSPFIVKKKDEAKVKESKTWPGIGALFKVPPSTKLEGPILALNGVSDPGNLGTLFRSALWFGVKAFLLDSSCADPYSEKTVRSSMGAICHLQIQQKKDFYQCLKEYEDKDYTLIGASLQGEEIPPRPQDNKWILVLGSEAHGLSPQIENLCKTKATIPLRGKGESLNVGVAGSILLHDLTKT